MKTPNFKAKTENGKWIQGNYCKTNTIINSNYAMVDAIQRSFTYSNIDVSTLCISTLITDKDGVEIFSDDIREYQGTKFRIYHVPGGFAIKAPSWMSDITDLKETDELILDSLSIEVIAWIVQSTKAAGNYHDLKNE